MVTQSLAVQCHKFKPGHGSVKVQHLYSLITCLEMTLSKNIKQIGNRKSIVAVQVLNTEVT